MHFIYLYISSNFIYTEWFLMASGLAEQRNDCVKSLIIEKYIFILMSSQWQVVVS